MWKWKKEFFYFSKGDRIGIILLLTLIIITGSIFIFMNNFSFNDSAYREKEEETQKGFVYFNKQLKEIEEVKDKIATEKVDSLPQKTKKTKTKTNNQKLELGQTIDLNSASAMTLTRIPSIGSTFAERIIEYRNSLGGFHSLEQLYDIKGITIKKYSTILPYLVLKKKHQTININKTEEEQLFNHPYFEDKHIQSIMELREHGVISDISVLSENRNFSSRDIQRLEPYLVFD